jgi:hypothetical protein
MMVSSHCMLKPAPGLRSPLPIDRRSDGFMLSVSDQKIKTKFKTGNVASKNFLGGTGSKKRYLIGCPHVTPSVKYHEHIVHDT